MTDTSRSVLVPEYLAALKQNKRHSVIKQSLAKYEEVKRLVHIDVLEDGEHSHRVHGRYGGGEGEDGKYAQLGVVESVESLQTPGYQEGGEGSAGKGQHQD